MPEFAQTFYSCTCATLQPQPNLFFCPHCISLRCHSARCTISSAEVAACPRCLRTTTPVDALNRLRGRCDAGASCLDCPKCGASLLVIDKQSAETTSGGATHKCKECSLFARFVNTPDSLIDDDSVASNAVAHMMRSSSLVSKNFCTPDPIGMATFEAAQRLNRIELRKQRMQTRKGSLKSITSGALINPPMSMRMVGIHNADPNFPVLPWLGLDSDSKHDLSSKVPGPIELEAQERELHNNFCNIDNHFKHQMNTLFGFKQQPKEKVICITVKTSGTRLASFRQIRCSSCVKAGDPGVLVSVSPEPFKALLLEAAERVSRASSRVNPALTWTPAYIFRKQSPAAAVLPSLSLVLVDTTIDPAWATRGVSVVKARLEIKNPTEKPMFISFKGVMLPVTRKNQGEDVSDSLLSFVDAQSNEGVLLIKQFEQDSKNLSKVSHLEETGQIFVRVSPNDPLNLHDEDEAKNDIDDTIVSSAAERSSRRVVAAEGVGSITINCSITMPSISSISTSTSLVQIPFVLHMAREEKNIGGKTELEIKAAVKFGNS